MTDAVFRRLLCALLVLLTAPAGAGETADTDELARRLDALEARWSTLEAELASLRALLQARAGDTAPPALQAVDQQVKGLRDEVDAVRGSVELQAQSLAAESQARQRAIAISTYGQIAAVQRQDSDSVFDARSFELVFSGQPHASISFFSELEFERAAMVGGDRGGEVLLEQAYIDYALGAELAFRAGVVLVPFGNNEADHYAPLREVVSRPLSSRLINPSDWTDNGFGLVGHRELAPLWQLDWEAYVLTGLGGELQGHDLRGLRQGFGEDNNNDKAVAAHLALRRGDKLSLGLGLYRGDWDAAGERALSGVGLDFVWYPAPWKLSGEYLHMRAERVEAGTARLRGGYLRLGYELDRWLPAGWSGAAFPDARLALVYEYDRVEADRLDDPAARAQTELKHIFGLRYEPDHSWNLKLNREWSQADGNGLQDGDADAWLLGVGFVF